VPTKRELADPRANLLPVTFGGGSITITGARFEGDVSPRPNGDQQVTVVDWVLLGLYAAGLDYPADGSQFQRADCAPRDTSGDGIITVADWVQAGRYALGLDQLSLAGGPTNEAGVLISTNPENKVEKLGANGRQLIATGGLLLPRQKVFSTVNLEAQGDENALGFSLGFDAAVLRLIDASLPENALAATLNMNTNEVAQGKIGMVIGLPIGSTFPLGTQHLVQLTFEAVSTNSTNSPLTFGDVPVLRETSDVNARTLSTTYTGSAVAITPLPSLDIVLKQQGITLSWPAWATNYLLQTSDDLGSSSVWTNADAVVRLTNGLSTATVPVSGSTRFYRLAHQ
jgi:hypothetical protein